MVDCRPASAAAPHDASNGASPPDPHPHQHNQQQGSGEGVRAVTSPGARASTPASAPPPAPPPPAMHHYAPPYQSPGLPPVPLGMPVAPYVSYVCGAGGAPGGKGLVWVPPPPPPPPHHVNPHALKSMQANGSDLPLNDMATLRHYYNLGVECMWAAYGAPPPLAPAPPAPAAAPPHTAPPPHHHPHHPPRHYSPRDIAQDMQQMSIQERGNNHAQDIPHKHKGAPNDKPMQTNGKGNGQRALVGPRFKRNNGQDNKNHNNNNHMNNKGPNNRTYYSRNSEPRHNPGYPEGEPLPEAPMLTLPYIPYPPPVYPVQYYPVDANDPAMMGMMSGMQYCGVGYEEALDYPHYYPPPFPAPPALHLPPQHEHK